MSRWQNRVRRTTVDDLAVIVEVGSTQETWTSMTGRLAKVGSVAAVVSDPPTSLHFPSTPRSVDINAQLFIRIFIMKMSTSETRLVFSSRVGAYDVIRSTPYDVEAVFRAGADQPLMLDRFDVERDKKLCPACTCSHKFFASAEARCSVKGNPNTKRYHVDATDFIITLDAKGHVCEHPVQNRAEFEELIIAMMNSTSV